MNEIIEVGGFQFCVRPNTLDQWIVEENLKGRVYLNKITLQPSDHWLDIGAHIGSFAISVAREVAEVICFEPEPENFALLRENVVLNDLFNVAMVPSAVMGQSSSRIVFYKNLKTNTGSHSFYVKRGREVLEVPCVHIEEVLAGTAANKIKIDAEGAEYEIIKAIVNWRQLEELVFEFDFQKLKDADHQKYFELLKLLESQGFIVDALREPTKHWHTVVHAVRP